MATRTKKTTKAKAKITKKPDQFGSDRHPDQEWIDAIIGQQHCSTQEAAKQVLDAKATGMTLKGWLEFNKQP